MTKRKGELLEDVKNVGADMKQAREEMSTEVKEKFRGMSALKIVVLLLFLVGTVLTFVFYNKIFADDSWFKTKTLSSGFLTKLIRAIPPVIKSIQIVTITETIVSILVSCLRHFFGRKTNRGKTVTLLVCNLIKWLTTIVLVIVVLAVWGVNTTALITGAGVLTLVVGLGMQSLIADVVAGLFIVFENEFNVGDIITVEDFRGTVTAIGIRTTKIEHLGNVKIINNSDLRNVLNQTTKPSTSYSEISVRYDSLSKVEGVLSAKLADVKVEGALGEVTYEGVKELGTSGVVLLFSAQCYEGDIYGVQRRMNRELKVLFDENGIEIPYDRLVVLQGENEVEQTFETPSDEVKEKTEAEE